MAVLQKKSASLKDYVTYFYIFHIVKYSKLKVRITGMYEQCHTVMYNIKLVQVSVYGSFKVMMCMMMMHVMSPYCILNLWCPVSQRVVMIVVHGGTERERKI